MSKTRRTFTPEFKAEAIKLITEQGKSLAKVAPGNHAWYA